jgi:hypothetical protein
MKHDRERRLVQFVALATAVPLVVLVLFTGPNALRAQTTQQDDEQVEAEEEQVDTGDDKPRFELYGHVMTDVGYSGNQIDPDWFDVNRPTKLDAFEDEFGEGGETYFSVRQTRFGFKSWVPTKLGEMYTIFEFELFGVGDDAGQTTFRLRHAYGEIGQFGAGQTWSPFMDIDVFPNSLEYWGPSGMVFFRNIQVRWMPIKGDTRLTVALERPGASGDQGRFEDRIELDGIQGNFPLPDLSAEYRIGRNWGYFEVAGMLRKVEWDDTNDDEFDLSGDAVGWGINLSSNVKLGDADTLRLQVVYGEGIENYMNDSTVDIGIEPNPGNPQAPIKGVPLPILGVVAFLDHSWGDGLSTAIGYSLSDIDNAPGQSPEAFSKGEYALVNLLHSPVPKMLYGAELQYGRRHNFSDGWSTDNFKIQFSFKYNFSLDLGGN